MKQLKNWTISAYPFLEEGAKISDFLELTKKTFKLQSLEIYKVQGEQLVSLRNSQIVDLPELLKNPKKIVIDSKKIDLGDKLPPSSEIFSFQSNDQAWHYVFLKGKFSAHYLLPVILPYLSHLTNNRDLNQNDFLSRLSHEIRTPLNAIMGELSYFQEEALSEKGLGALAIANKAAKTLLNSVDNIFLYTQDDLKAHIQNIKIDEFLNEVVSTNEDLFKIKKIKFDFLKETSRDILASDPVKMHKILSSFLTNAANFSPEEGRVRLKCFESGGEFILQVQDNGVGFSSEVIGQVATQGFVQEEDYATRTKGGSGLSLNICFKLAKSLGAKITIESTKNHGSLVSLRIPTTINAINENCSSFQGRLLLVEDEATNQIVIRRYLEKLGLEVVLAENGKIAVEIYRENPQFCAILMDCQMPVMDGYEATKLIKEINPEQIIIACTAHAFKEAETKCLESGMNDFIAKPVSIESLKQVFSTQIPEYGDHFDEHLVNEVVSGEENPLEGINFLENVLLKTFKSGLAGNYSLIECEKNPENLRKIFHKLKSSYAQLGFIKSQKHFAKLQKAESYSGQELTLIKKQTIADIQAIEIWLNNQKKKCA